MDQAHLSLALQTTSAAWQAKHMLPGLLKDPPPLTLGLASLDQPAMLHGALSEALGPSLLSPGSAGQGALSSSLGVTVLSLLVWPMQALHCPSSFMWQLWEVDWAIVRSEVQNSGPQGCGK